MPELPEVETIRLQLQKNVVGKKITDVRVVSGRKLNLSPAQFIRAVRGATIKGARRRAKLLLINLGNGWTMVIHLKMTGRVLLEKDGTAVSKHAFVVFKLSGGKQLVWEDVRKFGFLKLVKTSKLDDLWKKQGFGPEPLDSSFTPQVLAACLARHKGKRIKPLIMEQTCIAGLGNIYAAEVLWFAGVHPNRATGKIRDAEVKKMYDGIRKILPRAIDYRGSSADSYLDLFGKPGEFVPRLSVYDRDGKPCLRRDGGIIKKIRTGGRGTYYCSVCQI
ncbi:DNA-formamidopyrimidine glycosylase [Candidatus Uhrbacteria bacterium RIFCSPHIGHO2_12_FULL_57_11]|uniref:DNA-formamidopyrimidine glycosylase n=2 Tax=Candidatus Uhriibacteriota TaxID=1752732 RepID=A0A1F7UQ66_9BACT|nr:MAG: DNA-formamidopyrimidine glycosylase [Candidatus Uhrbacteria bacterium RIFCSPHIGHO2_02_FULL_57_19]OGL79848.1 MAG: DNA-formamidopyrimidine glycosylase [Candidatus Uhrbacteria bacterium RIFCSPHIGHO2_12_FULL_57_11]